MIIAPMTEFKVALMYVYEFVNILLLCLYDDLSFSRHHGI